MQDFTRKYKIFLNAWHWKLYSSEGSQNCIVKFESKTSKSVEKKRSCSCNHDFHDFFEGVKPYFPFFCYKEIHWKRLLGFLFRYNFRSILAPISADFLNDLIRPVPLFRSSSKINVLKYKMHLRIVSLCILLNGPLSQEIL